MIKEIIIKKEVDIAYAECKIFARYWQDSRPNGEKDDAEHPKMPCVETEKNYAGKDQLAWCPFIDLDEGRIVNWINGETAQIHYKSCDENEINLVDRDGEVVREYFGYVPDILDPYGEGYGDYVIMNIDEHGYIENFNNDVNDILRHEIE